MMPISSIHLLGPGHFVYMTLYHLIFAAALASIPLLLHKFDKLPNIIPHVATVYLFLGLIALFSITFTALNVVQCLIINDNTKRCMSKIEVTLSDCQYVKQTISKALKHINESEKILEQSSVAQETGNRGAPKDKEDGIAAHICNNGTALKMVKTIHVFRDIEKHIINILSLSGRLHRGDNFKYDPIELGKFTGGGLPTMDPYDLHL